MSYPHRTTLNIGALSRSLRIWQSVRLRLPRSCAAFFTGVAVLLCAGSGLAETRDFPTKPLRLVLATPPGQQADLLLRALAARISELTGKPAVVENKPGGNGIVSAQELLRAPPDGHTLLLISPSAAILAPLTQVVPYKPEQLRPVIGLTRHTTVLVTSGKSRFKSFDDLIIAARQDPVPASFGNYTIHYKLQTVQLSKAMGGKFNMVSYTSAAQIIAGLVEGSLDVGIVDVSSAIPLLKSGALRALAVPSPERLPDLPDVPTILETGVNFSATVFTALAVRSDTPEPIVREVEALLDKAVNHPEYRALVAKHPGATVTGLSAKQASEMIKSERVQYERALREIGGVIPQ